MYWIYILKCEDDVYYVGQTSRLYRRFWEHQDGRGGLNTFVYKPEEIVAIYKVSGVLKFLEYNKKIININENSNLMWSYNSGFNNPSYVMNNWEDVNYEDGGENEAENNIAECMMMHDKENWEKIRGGKYVRFDCDYEIPNNKYIKELPLCNCGLPCDVKKHDNKNSIFFRCAKKNMWEKFREEFDVDEPCKFYREYMTDIELRVGAKHNFETRRNKIAELMKKSSWLVNVPCEEDGCECISCNQYVGCDREGNYKNNAVTYYDDRRLLCFDCFIDKNEALAKRYSLLKGKCLISL
jgi:putative endonuclease